MNGLSSAKEGERDDNRLVIALQSCEKLIAMTLASAQLPLCGSQTSPATTTTTIIAFVRVSKWDRLVNNGKKKE